MSQGDSVRKISISILDSSRGMALFFIIVLSFLGLVIVCNFILLTGGEMAFLARTDACIRAREIAESGFVRGLALLSGKPYEERPTLNGPYFENGIPFGGGFFDLFMEDSRSSLKAVNIWVAGRFQEATAAMVWRVEYCLSFFEEFSKVKPVFFLEIAPCDMPLPPTGSNNSEARAIIDEILYERVSNIKERERLLSKLSSARSPEEIFAFLEFSPEEKYVDKYISYTGSGMISGSSCREERFVDIKDFTGGILFQDGFLHFFPESLFFEKNSGRVEGSEKDFRLENNICGSGRIYDFPDGLKNRGGLFFVARVLEECALKSRDYSAGANFFEETEPKTGMNRYNRGLCKVINLLLNSCFNRLTDFRIDGVCVEYLKKFEEFRLLDPEKMKLILKTGPVITGIRLLYYRRCSIVPGTLMGRCGWKNNSVICNSSSPLSEGC